MGGGSKTKWPWVRGLASVLKSSPNAKFACSAALEKTIFMELVALSEQSLPELSGVALASSEDKDLYLFLPATWPQYEPVASRTFLADALG
jgi:hypothetical protein